MKLLWMQHIKLYIRNVSKFATSGLSVLMHDVIITLSDTMSYDIIENTASCEIQIPKQ